MAFIPPLIAAAATAASAVAGTVGSAAAAAGSIATATASTALGAVGLSGASSVVAANGLVASLGGAGTILSAGGTLASAIAAKQAADYNAKMDEAQGRQASEAGALAASEATRQKIQRMAAASAGAIQNGFETSGSIGDLLSQADRQGNLDYLTSVYDGSVRNAGAMNSAALSRAQGRGALIGGIAGAGTKMVNGMSDVYRRRTAQIGV